MEVTAFAQPLAADNDNTVWTVAQVNPQYRVDYNRVRKEHGEKRTTYIPQ